jgi:hypothetical protein
VSPGARLGWGVALVLLVSTPARAQDPAADDPAVAVRLARAAFEYRDFKRVTAVLEPWLHPPRIVDRGLEVEARKLMGVSLHVLGDKKAAAEEFGQLLELDPKHELDPFAVPPAVIQTFEEVRAKMKPRLDAVGPGPDKPPPVAPPEVRLVETVHPAVALLPFGIPQFVADRPGWGAVWSGLQVGFLALNVVGFLQARTQPEGSGAYRAWTAAQYVGVAGFLGTWGGSSVQGYLDLTARRDAALAPPAGPGPAAHVTFDLSF